MNRHIIKSIWAVSAGIITIVTLSVGTDLVLESYGIFPPPHEGFPRWMLMLALVYRCLFAIAGGYVTAALSPDNRMRHAIILGLIGLVVSIFGAIVAWELSSHWYPVALIITALPCTWLGGQMQNNSMLNDKRIGIY